MVAVETTALDAPDQFVLIHIDNPAAESRLVRGSRITGSGWVVAEREVAEVAIYFDDTFLGYATYGESRPEIGERFPHYPQSDSSGFSFSLPLAIDAEPGTSGWIYVQVTTRGGGFRRKGVPVTLADPGAVDEVSPRRALPSVGAIKIAVESARIDAGGLLRVSGWLLSLGPLRSIELSLGDVPLGAPEQGLSRPDVALNHPDYEQAGNSGFKLVQDISHLDAKRPVLRVRATAFGGVTRQVIVPVTLPERQRAAVNPDDAINLCVDSLAVRSNGQISADGWAVAAAGIQDIVILIDDVAIGNASTGGDRPDVGNRFPRIPSARRSGFAFRKTMDNALQGEHLVTLRVTDAAGGQRSVQLPVMVEVLETPDAVSGYLGADGDIRFDIDAPSLDGDRARDPVRGVLTVSGWAVSAAGVDYIEVFIEEQSLGRAYYGMRREDIAAAFPGIESALLSGFAMTLPHRLLGSGERHVRVVFKDKSGKDTERSFSVDVSESEETISSTQLRQRVRQTEIDLVCEGVSPDQLPLFEIGVRSSGSTPQARDALQATLSSLSQQAYPRWRAHVIPTGLEDFAELKTLVESGDQGFELEVEQETDIEPAVRSVSGANRFVAYLRAGDLLGADALLQMASAAIIEPDLDLIYSDDRRLSTTNHRVAAFFKPQWSPELNMAMNYLGRSWVVSDRLLRVVGLSTEITDHSDYDWVLRLTEQATKIRHIPHVLVDTENGGRDSEEDEQSALEAALVRQQIEADVLPGRAPATWRIKRHLKTRGKVSFIIPTCAARGLIRTCIETVRDKTRYKNYELIVLDNIPESLPDDRLWVEQNSDKILRITEKFNWSRFNNLGVAQAEGDFLLFLNDDIEVLDGDWLETLLEQAERPEIGVVGTQLLYPDGKVQHAGMFLSGAHGRHAFRFSERDDPGYFGLALTQRNLISVTGACLLSRRAAYESIGGFDEAHSVVNNDLDYCLRMWRSGLRVVYTPFTSLIHHELASRAAISDIFDEKRFLGDWSNTFSKGDPFFNPNLATDVDTYAVETEPVEIVNAVHPLIRATSVKNILAVKLDHIGDFITALPALRRLKQRFPDARLCVLAAKASKALAVLEPCIDEVIEFNFYHARSSLGRKELTEEDLAALRSQLAPYQFDLAIDLRMQGDTRHVLQCAGARLLAGYDHAARFPWLDVALEWEGDASFTPKRTHVVDRLCQLVDATGIACEPETAITDGITRDEALAVLEQQPAIANLPTGFLQKRLVVVHPAAGNDTKQWPEDYFAALIDLLVAEQGVNVILIGGPDELALADRVMAKVQAQESVASVLGLLELRHLPLLLRIAALFVGNDSGPKHLAARLGTPTVGVHSGIVDATEWGPAGPRALAIRRKTVCTPCYVPSASDCHRNLACLRKLLPGDVYAACKRMLVIDAT